MKTLFLFLLTCFAVTAALFGALYAPHPLLLYVLAALCILAFTRYCIRRRRRIAARREMEKEFLYQFRRGRR